MWLVGVGGIYGSRRDCKYQQEWQNHRMLPSTKGPGFGRCKYCNTDINISHGGVYDVKKHLSSSKHQEMVKAVGSSRNVREFFQQSPIEQAVTRAEVLFSNFVAEHNLPFMTADHFTHLTSSMFPDSKISQAFSCARTKTTCIVKGALHPHELGKPVTRFFDIPVCNIGRAEVIFNRIAGKPAKCAYICSYWQQAGQIKTLHGVAIISRLAKCVLALAVSNADTERMLSMVRKIVTDYLTELNPSTLCALLSCKLNCNSSCFNLHTPDELLSRAKHATVEYNKAHATQ